MLPPASRNRSDHGGRKRARNHSAAEIAGFSLREPQQKIAITILQNDPAIFASKQCQSREPILLHACPPLALDLCSAFCPRIPRAPNSFETLKVTRKCLGGIDPKVTQTRLLSHFQVTFESLPLSHFHQNRLQ